MPRPKQMHPPAHLGKMSPADYRAKYPKVKDAAFADAISVPEACEIMKCTRTHIYKLIRSGQLAGKILTRASYLVSRRAAEANAADYREAKGSRSGRPRSRA